MKAAAGNKINMGALTKGLQGAADLSDQDHLFPPVPQAGEIWGKVQLFIQKVESDYTRRSPALWPEMNPHDLPAPALSP
jgi:hypothetical protein